jgi:DNA-directed RNA polymerase specialized sigma24 family protein
MIGENEGMGDQPECWTDASIAIRGARRDPVDDTAWRELWSRYHKLVSWKIAAVDPNQPQARVDELAAETFRKVFETIHLYDPDKARLSTFVLKIAENTALDDRRHLRRERAATVPDGQVGEHQLESVSDSAVPLAYLATVVERAEQRLPPGDKRLIFKRLLRGDSVADIVRTSEWNESYVRRTRSESLRAVSEVLAETVAENG